MLVPGMIFESRNFTIGSLVGDSGVCAFSLGEELPLGDPGLTVIGFTGIRFRLMCSGDFRFFLNNLAQVLMLVSN